jgi:hypothetical protein
MVNDDELVAVPPAVTTCIVPDVPDPTTTVNTVPVLETMDDTAVPPIVTLDAETPDKLVPLITKLVPTHPIEEPKLVIVGVDGATTVNV